MARLFHIHHIFMHPTSFLNSTRFYRERSIMVLVPFMLSLITIGSRRYWLRYHACTMGRRGINWGTMRALHNAFKGERVLQENHWLQSCSTISINIINRKYEWPLNIKNINISILLDYNCIYMRRVSWSQSSSMTLVYQFTS